MALAYLGKRYSRYARQSENACAVKTRHKCAGGELAVFVSGAEFLPPMRG